MEQRRLKDLEEKINTLKCPYDFMCSKSRFKDLCDAQDIGMESFIVCLDKTKEGCVFSISLAGLKFCRCPLRVYLAKVLKK